MFAKLLLLFTVIPLIELSLLIPLGTEIGIWPTLAIVFTTAIAGALLGKYQGMSAWKRIQSEMGRGQVPGDALLDGLAVLIASAFLVTPGVLTDFAGFILLIPFTRGPIKKLVRKRVDKWLEAETVGFMSFDAPDFGPDPFDVYGAGQRGRADDIIIEPAEPAATHREEEEVIQITAQVTRD